MVNRISHCNKFDTDGQQIRVSASNAAKLYKMSLMKDYFEEEEWQFVPRLTTEHVWDAFVIVSLLDDKFRRNEHLQVPHTGQQKDRFTEAMQERNENFVINGQPDAVQHACDKCLRIYKTTEGDRDIRT
jgi:hypothetical protein